MKPNELKTFLVALLESARLAVLATSFGDEPHASLVGFAGSADLKGIAFATTRGTRKYENLHRNPRVSLLIDNAANGGADFGEAAAVTIAGRARQLSGDERQRWLKVYLARHPYLQDFVHAPTCALFVVDVDRYRLVTHFQNVSEFIPGP